jgi:ABC-2 type transport system ATP-binding protein
VLAIAAKGGQATTEADGTLLVRGMATDQVGDIAFENEIRLHELTAMRASLEEAFMELTGDSVEYRAEIPAAGAPAGSPAVGSPTVGSGV